MKSKRHLPLLTQIAFHLLPALLVLASLPCKANVPTPAVPPPPPAGYCQAIDTELTTDLNAFNATLNSLWNGSTYPVLYAGNLAMANGNIGPTLTNSTLFVQVQDELVELQAMGYQAVLVQVEFPILYAPFYSSQAQYQQYVSFYAQVAAAIRAMGMQMIVENDVLLSSDDQAGWTNTTAFYGTLNWAQYQAARATMAATVAQVMQPDYLVLAEEPDNEATQALQPNINIPADAAAMVSAEIAAVQALNLPTTPQLGAGTGSWVVNLTQYISDYAALPLNYIDFHIYPINNVNGQSFIANGLTIASIAAAAGLPVAMSETWMWKMEASEWLVLTPDQLRARDPFSFWAPVNTLFLQTMQNLANYTQMLYQSPSEPDYFFGYQTYGGTTANGGAANCTCTTTSCTDITIDNAETTLAQTANLASAYTTTGMSYYNSLVSPPDTITPSIPLNLTGSAVLTTVNLAWNASTDDTGVAGYNVIRNGLWIANSSVPQYKDSGLLTSTTYNYQIQAFDLAGNTSLSSATLALATEYTIPPTAPANVVATPYSPVGITLTWSASQDPMGVSSYEIFRGTSPAGLLQVSTVHGTTLSYTDYTLTPSTTYYYGVEATQGSFVSAMSAIASASTLPLPNTPTNLAAAPTSGTRISLSWTDSVPPNGLPIGSYQVYCGQAPGGLTKVAATLNSSYTYNNLAAGTTYYCAVLAADTAGDLSAMSAPVSAITYATPNAPTAVVATANSSTKVTVNWTETVVANGLPIASYQIYRGISPNNLSQVAVRATASYVDYSVSPLATYYYAVQATDTGNDASPISANTQVAVP